jgi:repressor LexA
MAKNITKRQREVLQFIIDSIRDRGLPPTISEICEEFNISSTNGASDHLTALEKKGYIERTSKAARSIRLTPKASTVIYHGRAATAPLVGQVAAGYPILAEENIEDHIPVDSDLAERGAFCLGVRGDSMIEAGIFDGDIVVVDPSRRAREGDVVVALVEDDATVKYYHPKGHDIELRPANAAMEPIMAPASSVHIQGVVAALQRKF